jgi:hypothetical protein
MISALAAACGDDDGQSGHSHEEEEHREIIVSSAAQGGGELQAAYDFDHLHLSFSACLGGMAADCSDGIAVYSAATPGFETADEDGHEGEGFVLTDAVPVTLQVVAIDAGLSIRFASTVLDAAGEAVLLGSSPFHADLETQAVVENAELPKDGWHVTFRLTTTDARYAPSADFTIRFGRAHD